MQADLSRLTHPILERYASGDLQGAECAMSQLREQLPVDQAVTAIDAVLRQRPDWIHALDELGRCMMQLREFRAAFNIGARIVQLAGDDERGLELQALAMEHAGARAEQVLPLRRRLAKAAPNSAAQQFLLATTASRVGYYAEMHDALDATLRLEPNLLMARWAKFLTPRDKFFASEAEIERFVHDWDEGCAAFERIDLDAPSVKPRLEGLLIAQCNFHLAYTGIDVTSRQIRLGRLLRRFASGALASFDRPLTPRALPGRKLRIGFLTATLRHHTVNKLFGDFMRLLPRDRFEVHAYALESGSDALTEQLKRELDRVRTEIAPLAVMAERIRDDACDALIYLDIGMHPRTVALSALRLAPLQAMLWGHPVTSGVDTIDLFLSSDLMEPDDGAQHYSERLHRLPGLGCHYDPTSLPVQPESIDARQDGVIRIVCAQNGLKLLPAQDAVFADILACANQAELVLLCGLHAGIEANLVARMRPVFAARGVDFERRVRIVGHTDETTFLTELWQADLVLDSLCWSGGVTAFETFYGNVPILTLPGAFMRARHTCAMLQTMELPELICSDEADFVARAVTLCTDHAARQRLRALIAERKQRLYCDARVIADLADVLSREISARCA